MKKILLLLAFAAFSTLNAQTYYVQDESRFDSVSIGQADSINIQYTCAHTDSDTIVSIYMGTPAATVASYTFREIGRMKVYVGLFIGAYTPIHFTIPKNSPLGLTYFQFLPTYGGRHPVYVYDTISHAQIIKTSADTVLRGQSAWVDILYSTNKTLSDTFRLYLAGKMLFQSPYSQLKNLAKDDTLTRISFTIPEDSPEGNLYYSDGSDSMKVFLKVPIIKQPTGLYILPGVTIVNQQYLDLYGRQVSEDRYFFRKTTYSDGNVTVVKSPHL